MHWRVRNLPVSIGNSPVCGGMEMKVKIDYDLCMGDRNCNKLCPEVFDYDEDQFQARIIVDEVPERFQERVRQAAAECAPGAIIIIEK